MNNDVVLQDILTSNDDDYNQQYQYDTNDNSWSEVYDQNSGNYYYYNTVTGETTWEYPYSTEDNNNIDSNGINTEIIDSYNENDYNDNTIDQNYDYSNENEEYTPISYWTSLTDETSGQIYYYNTYTHETQWEIPEEYLSYQSYYNNNIDSYDYDNSPSNQYSNTEEYPTPINLKDNPIFKKFKGLSRHSIANPKSNKELIKHKEISNKISSIYQTPLLKNNNSVNSDKGAVNNYPSVSGIINNQTISNNNNIISNNNQEISNNIDSTYSNIKTIDLNVFTTDMSIDDLDRLVNNFNLIDYIVIRYNKPPNFVSTYIWDNDVISEPITIKSVDSLIINQLTIPLNKLCCKLYYYILLYMNDITTTNSQSNNINYLYKLITKLIFIINNNRITNSYVVIDEIYIQICKQLINNPTIQSLSLGWQLLIVLITICLPSNDLIPYIISFCYKQLSNRSSIQSNSIDKLILLSIEYLLSYIETLHNQSISNYISNQLNRRNLLSSYEIYCLWTGEGMTVTIITYLPNLNLVIDINSYTTIGMLRLYIIKKLNISLEYEDIFILVDGINNQEVELTTRVVDVVIDNINSYHTSPYRLLFKLNYLIDIDSFINNEFITNKSIVNIESDIDSKADGKSDSKLDHKVDKQTYSEVNILIKLYYYQCINEVKNLSYPLLEYELFTFASIQYYIENLTENLIDRSTNSSNNLTNRISNESIRNINTTLYKIFHNTIDNKLDDEINNQFEDKNIIDILTKLSKQLDRKLSIHQYNYYYNYILKLYQTLLSNNYSLIDSMLLYITILSNNQLFSCKYYYGETNLSTNHSINNQPIQILICLTNHGILLLDKNTKKHISRYNYNDIVSYTYSNRFFILLLGNKPNNVINKKVYINTKQCKEIKQVIDIFMKYHMVYEKDVNINANNSLNVNTLTPIVTNTKIFTVDSKSLPPVN